MTHSLTEEATDWLRSWQHQGQKEGARVVLAAEAVVGLHQWEPEAETHWREPREHHHPVLQFCCWTLLIFPTPSGLYET